MFENRDMRQRSLLPPDKLKQTCITVVGVGAIGRQVALQLSAVGVDQLNLFDFDTVEVENLAPQGFRETDLGKPKVDAVSSLCAEINSEIHITGFKRKFLGPMFVDGVCFCCVDRIETRKQIFNSIKDKCDLFVDGRMGAEFLRVLAVHDEKSKEYYGTQFFPQNEAFQGSCTAKSTIYCANIAAGIMVAQFAKWVRGCPELIDNCVELNILTNEMVVK